MNNTKILGLCAYSSKKEGDYIMVTLTNMQVKEIIFVETGEKIGNIIDLEIDVDKGIITHVVIAMKNKMMGLFGKQEEVIIPWDHIVTVGSDVILIKETDLK
ncbi:MULTISPECIES: YlmC/YmxH family sporulation protein [Paraliobacillus]|uniref:YlmC/YmxH family sporulation protein n=1 Tax=Paraliobacillus TaxID=200903 RepID=UPI001E3DB978|nr:MULTISPECIES: YlmC/YmxH family sporulation protein [Paraliobacillus]